MIYTIKINISIDDDEIMQDKEVEKVIENCLDTYNIIMGLSRGTCNFDHFMYHYFTCKNETFTGANFKICTLKKLKFNDTQNRFKAIMTDFQVLDIND